ncbi:annexin [Physcia stellaris]|nr:annexin [Physcia stellaris]
MPTPPTLGYAPSQDVQYDASKRADELRSAMKGFGPTSPSSSVLFFAHIRDRAHPCLKTTYNQRHHRSLEKDIESETSRYFEDRPISILGPPRRRLQPPTKRSKAPARANPGSTTSSSAAQRRHARHQASLQSDHAPRPEADVRGDLSGKTERLFMMIVGYAARGARRPCRRRGRGGAAPRDGRQSRRRAADDPGDRARVRGQNNGARSRRSSSASSAGIWKTLVDIVRCGTDRAMRDAQRLEECMKGPGTKDELLVARVVQMHWDRAHMAQVKGAYRVKYGKELVDSKMTAVGVEGGGSAVSFGDEREVRGLSRYPGRLKIILGVWPYDQRGPFRLPAGWKPTMISIVNRTLARSLAGSHTEFGLKTDPFNPSRKVIFCQDHPNPQPGKAMRDALRDRAVVVRWWRFLKWFRLRILVNVAIWNVRRRLIGSFVDSEYDHNQLLNSLKRLPHPLKSHSSPCRPHCMTVPELLDREDFGREEVVVLDIVVLDLLGWGSVVVDGLLGDEGEVCARGDCSRADLVLVRLMVRSGVVLCLKLRQWKREKKVGVEGEEVGVMAVEGEGEEDGEMDSFIV